MEPQKREFDWKTFGVFLIPVLAAFIAAGIVVYLVLKAQIAQTQHRSQDISQYELRRLISLVNFRLNGTREELVHIHHQLLTLNPSIPVDQKEKVLFLRREFLGGFALFQAKNKLDETLELKQLWMRKGGLVPQGYPQTGQIQTILTASKEAAVKSGFDIRRLEQKDILNADNSPVTAMNTGTIWFILSYMTKDFNGTDSVYTGIYSSQYLFPFCRQLSSQLEKVATFSYITDDSGTIVCHATARNEGGSVRDLEFFKRMKSEPVPQDPNAVSLMNYQSAQQIEVNGSFKKVNGGRLFLISESSVTKEWDAYIPKNETLALFFFCIAVTLGVALSVSSKTGGKSEEELQAEIDSLRYEDESPEKKGVKETSESTSEITVKIEKELEELRNTALALQSENAHLISFQTTATQSRNVSELLDRVVKTFENDFFGRPVHAIFLALETDIQGKPSLRAIKGSRDVSPTLVAGLKKAYSEDKFEDELARRLPFSPLRFYISEIQDEKIGCWVFGGLEHRAQNETEAIAFDLLPVVLQTFAMAYALLKKSEAKT